MLEAFQTSGEAEEMLEQSSIRYLGGSLPRAASLYATTGS